MYLYIPLMWSWWYDVMNGNGTILWVVIDKGNVNTNVSHEFNLNDLGGVLYIDTTYKDMDYMWSPWQY